jgi:predicted lysophospholipase L1 biosynthesis ABC-type transport system permease subunit
MKMRMYWHYATRSLLRGGQRSLLALFCVAVGVMAIVALQLVGNAINTGLTSDMLALNGGDVAVASTAAPISQGQLSYLKQLQAQGTITSYTSADELNGVVHAASGSQFFPVDAVDPAHFPLEGAPVFTDPAGASLESVLHGNTVAITSLLAQNLDLSVGSTLQVYTADGRSPTVTVGAIIQDSGLFRGALLLINLADYAALPGTGAPLTYTTIYADVPGHTDANALAAEQLLQAHFPLATMQTTAQTLAANQASVQEIRYFLQIVGLLALLIGGVGIVNTMQVLLRRRRNEIAMLKTAGYRRGDLYALFGLEAGLIGMIGGVVGAAAGVGVSMGVTRLVEQSIQFTLPTTVDAATALSGVAVGFVTALIFGLLPIVDASQIRPQAVLRDLPEESGRWKQRGLSLALLALLAVLFFALSLSIVRNVTVTALAVGGAAALLALLGLLLGLVVLLLGKLPVPDTVHWWALPPAGLALLAAVALTVAAPAFGFLCLLALVLLMAAALLPRAWKANVKLALRNIARQKARTVATLLALYIGVFSVGLIVVFGQNISDSLNTFLAQGNGTNAEIVASGATRAAVEHQLALAAGVKHEIEVPFSAALPVAINGQPIAQFVQAATASGTYTAGEVAGAVDGVQGYDLASGTVPDPVDVTIARGSHDAEPGRSLTAGDAGTRNALLPVAASQAPDNLTLGSTVTLANPTGPAGGTAAQANEATITVTIVGFYSSTLPQFGPALTDIGVVDALSAGAPQYGFRLHLAAASVDQTLAQIQTAVPGVVTYSLADFVGQFAAQLHSLITVLVAVASLALLASIIIIANAVALAMLERRRELGILKALGHTSRSVLGEVLVENGVIGFTGGLLAMLVAAALATVLGTLAFNLPIGVPAPTVLVVVLATAVVCMLVAAMVAWGAVRVRPVAVLRYE